MQVVDLLRGIELVGWDRHRAYKAVPQLEPDRIGYVRGLALQKLFLLDDPKLSNSPALPVMRHGKRSYNVQWVGGPIYFAPVAPLEDTTAFHVFEDGQWSQFEIGIGTDFCGSWDSVGEELFMGIYPDVGFYVLDTTTNQVVREFEIGIPVSRQLGVYVDGSFYTHDWSGAVYRFDAYDGTYEDTGFTPTSAFPSAALNSATRKIYLAGSQDELDHFEVYDTLDESVTTLAAPPFDVPTFNAYTSLVLIFPSD